MNRHLKIVLGLLLLGGIALGAAKVLLPLWQDRAQRSTSDAKAIKGTLRLAMDNWIGYAPLCSEHMAKRMRQSGYLLECVNDNADYPERMARLKKGEYPLAVATVDSYLLNGEAVNFPATMVAVIDESFGGDGFVAWKNSFENLDAFKRAPSVRVALTPASPSEHLAKAAAVHFDISALRVPGKPWLVATDGSEEAMKRLLDKEVPAAVLWEPDLSRALAKGKGEIVKLLSTEVTRRLVVDVLLAGRTFAEGNPEAVKILLANYFQTLKFFRDNPEALKEEIEDRTDLGGDQIDVMLKGVRFATLADNAQQWFGISASFGALPEEGLVETINGATRILIGSGDFAASPVPDNNPYRLLNSQFIAELFQSDAPAGQFTAPGAAAKAGIVVAFPPLSAEQWESLRRVGTLQVRPIVFQSGTESLSHEGKLELDKAAESLQHYPALRILVDGHTSRQGDPEANRALSLARAEAVKRYLVLTHGIEENRIRAIGYGGDRPLSQQSGESLRAYNYRLPRVEVALAAEAY